MEQHKIYNLLKDSGWLEGRNEKNIIRRTLLGAILPEAVISFYNSFLGLKIIRISPSNRILEEINIDNIDILNDNQVYNYYLSIRESLKLNKEVDKPLGEKDNLYYYSVLIGTELFEIGTLKQYIGLYMDAQNNFYTLTDINTFYWIGNNAIDALKFLLFGEGAVLGLDEKSIKWVSDNISSIKHIPPINTVLKVNPWS